MMMKILSQMSGLFAALLFTASVYAGDIQVEGAWSRATAPGQDAGMIDLTITSAQAARLIGASSPAAKTTELHTMVHENGMMKMREVKEIELPAGKQVNLGKAGFHLMLIGLKAPLKAGEMVPVTLNIQVSKETPVKIEAQAEVKSMTEQKGMSPHGGHHH